ncbi:hypothetical protein ACH35V_08390 [Actinomadura sp. 1N219]|uniref:hypothetical protein n=1 Tax=Actinomadura sp. 1N219 TaxID=3375152 RepID=UPI0037B4FCBB
MDPVRVDEFGDEVVRVRGYTSWLGALLYPASVAVLFLLGLTSSGTLFWTVWWVATAGLTVSGVVTQIREARGLTFNADGITWHRIELFVPWTQVTELDVDSGIKGTEKLRLIVRVIDPQESPRGHREIARSMITGNVRAFGGPIALPVHRLAVPPESLIATADRLQPAAPAPSVPGVRERQARRARAHRTSRLWGYAGATAFGLMLVATFIL